MSELSESMMVAFTGITVSDSSENPFNSSIFKMLKPIAQIIVEKRVGTLDEDTFNYLWALMVAHLWTIRVSDPTLKSETIGNYSYTRDTEKSTKYLAEFEDMLYALSGGDAVMVVPIPKTTKGAVDGLLDLD